MKPSKKILLTILATSLATMVALIIFANLRNPQKELAYVVSQSDPVKSPGFIRTIGELLGPVVIEGNKIESLYNGDQIFPPMLEAIRSAQKTITFESYIYWSGDIGLKFAEALSSRARAGVKVHVLIDAVGSEKIEKSYIELMKNAGVEIELYHPLNWYDLTKMNNRTHRKLLVTDGKIGFTGGVGIADEWSGNGVTPEKWRDTHFKVTGPVVNQMQAAFMDNWLKVRPEVHYNKDYFPELKANGSTSAQMFKSSHKQGSASARVMYLLALAGAQKSILLESAYFVPDQQTVDEIVKAKKRGVAIEIIVPSEKTDSNVIRHASRRIWKPLLEAGVMIYEYQPALFHCKVLIIDNYFVSVGSTNFDERSFRLNDEANLNVFDQNFATLEAKAFERDKTVSREITLSEWKQRPLKERVIEELAILFRSQL